MTSVLCDPDYLLKFLRFRSTPPASGEEARNDSEERDKGEQWHLRQRQGRCRVESFCLRKTLGSWLQLD